MARQPGALDSQRQNRAGDCDQSCQSGLVYPVHWSPDEWQTSHDITARDTGLGTYVADLPTAELPAGSTVRFTFYWPEDSRWEQQDCVVQVGA